MALGEKLLEAARQTRIRACLVAPFIKVPAIERLFAELSDDVEVSVVTRWIPAEIAAGVCDLEVFDVVHRRARARLHLNDLLHAKLYRFDSTYIFGSANLTGKALGWRGPANVELLHAAAELNDELQEFETRLLSSSMVADARYRDKIKEQVSRLLESGFPASALSAPETDELPPSWLPRCPTPERLWDVYSDPEAARRRMVASAFEAARRDLDALRIQEGLMETQFYKRVGGLFHQLPLVQSIDRQADRGVGPDEVAALIASAGGVAPYSSSEMWEILLAWHQYFFPDSYRRESTGEMLRRRHVLG